MTENPRYTNVEDNTVRRFRSSLLRVEQNMRMLDPSGMEWTGGGACHYLKVDR